jgi:hypothetical protein
VNLNWDYYKLSDVERTVWLRFFEENSTPGLTPPTVPGSEAVIEHYK